MNEPAPLADADLNELQGLTLEDLARLHGEGMPDSPATMDVSAQNDAPIETDIGFALQAHAGHTDVPVWTDEAPSADKQLRQALVMSFGSDEVHLDQKDDQRRIADAAARLLQESLPQSMQRMSQFLHAREQSDYLYERLAELSNRRGAALEIIQTAKQIEQVEKVLSHDRPDPSEISRLEQELAQFEQVLARYREICRIALELS